MHKSDSESVVATLNVSTVSGVEPDLRHDRALRLALSPVYPRDYVSVTVAKPVTSVIVSGLADGRCARAPIGPLSSSTDTRVVVSVVLRVKVPP